jgi:hypothetical protein
MDYVCTEMSRPSVDRAIYECISPITPAETPQNCHATFNLPKGSALVSIADFRVFVSKMPGEAPILNVRAWEIKVGQGNVGFGEAFFISWSLGDYRVNKDNNFKTCFGKNGPLVLRGSVTVIPPP